MREISSIEAAKIIRRVVEHLGICLATRYIAELSGPTTGKVVGLAQNRHQAGRNRPQHETPVEGLLLVGRIPADAG